MSIGRKIARRFGYSLTPQFKSEDATEILAAQLRRLNIGLIVDVGAQFGGLVGVARAAGFTGTIICVEPNPDCASRLMAVAAADGRVTVLTCACSAASGEATLHRLPDGDGLTSVHPMTPLALKRFATARAPMTKTTTRLRTVADIVADHGGDAPVFLSTDAQGHDAAVLRGASACIDQIAMFQSECAATSLYEDAGTHWEVLDFAREHGFAPVAFRTVSRARDGLLMEYDALFARP